MTAYLRADSVTLELPLDVQRVDDGERASGFKAALGGSSRSYRDVLKNISFTAEEGDRIGVLGLNGAGKTTLLRVLNGAFPPTLGKVERRGSTQSLLNATLGFSEYASVTENVILRGSAMGLRRRQLEAALPDILGFSGLTDRATHRLRTLSSGQRMRLGFAISTAVQPDILLMDEWIATGDAAFIKRAQDRLRSRVNDSRIVVLASHSTKLLREMCNKAIVLDEGRMQFFGDIARGLDVYRDIVSSADASLRELAAIYDPLLFGDAKGLLERVSCAGDLLEVEGWAVGERGNAVDSLVVEIGDRRHVVNDFTRIERADVLRHLGKRSGAYGFKVQLPVQQMSEGQWVIDTVTVCQAMSKQRMGPPLPRAHGCSVNVSG